MRKRVTFMKKFLAVLLSLCLLFSCGTIYVSADDASEYVLEGYTEKEAENVFIKFLYNFLDLLIELLVWTVNVILPDPSDWVDMDDYETENVLEGTTEFLSEPAEDAVWSMGYSSASLIEGLDIMDGTYYVAGGLSLSTKTVSSIVDDLRVRTIAMDDGSDRGITVFVTVDAYGLSSTTVREIREYLAEEIETYNIVSLNVSSLHQHSAVDTYGLNGSILSELLNPIRNLLGIEMDNGINDTYMENMYEVIAQTVTEAIESMTTGTLYYGTADISDYVVDKRAPYVLDTSIDRFRFVPSDGGREIWFTTSPIHCTGLGADGTDVSGDYPYYIEQYINEYANADFLMVMSANQATRQDKTVASENYDGDWSSLTKAEQVELYGYSLAELICDITEETEVEPLLNIAHTEIFLKATNPILVFAAKMGLLENTVVRDSFCSYSVASEIGYMELGTSIAVIFSPGELAAELAYGGTLSADVAWNGTDWEYPSLNEIIGSEKHLIIFSLTNDQCGYIIPDNDFMPYADEDGRALEISSLGENTASTFVTEFMDFYSTLTERYN